MSVTDYAKNYINRNKLKKLSLNICVIRKKEVFYNNVIYIYI